MFAWLIAADGHRCAPLKFPIRFRKDTGIYRSRRVAASQVSGALGADGPLPATDRATIDMDETRSRVIADTAASEAKRRIADLVDAAPLAPQIDRHSLDVITVLGDADTFEVEPSIRGRRTIAAHHQERIGRVEAVAEHPQDVEDAGIHWPDFARIMIAQDPVDVAHRLTDVVAVSPVDRTQPLAGMNVVERYRSRSEGHCRGRLDQTNGRNSSRGAEQPAPAQHCGRVQWLLPPVPREGP